MAGVDVVVDRTLYEIGETIHFTANPFPRIPSFVRFYVWNFGERNSPEKQSLQNDISHKYKHQGLYTVVVTANNQFSERRSQPIQIRVEQRLSTIQLILEHGETVLGHKMEFLAYHFEGSNVKYYWDFGDGTLINTTLARLHHIYQT